MTVFKDYAQFYDLLYQDKDYRAEAAFVNDLIREYGPTTRSILEMGCGTGRHGALLAEIGYEVKGVDFSAQMLARAKSRRDDLESAVRSRIRFAHGDIRDFRLGRKFDAVVALFHVVSYQTKNDDLLSTFRTARAHCKPGGLLIFDFWYGPAVLTERPSVRVARFESDAFRLTRIAEPRLNIDENVVHVNYQLIAEKREEGRVFSVEETHTLRFLFKPEIEGFLDRIGCNLLTFEEWLTRRPADDSTWSVVAVGKV